MHSLILNEESETTQGVKMLKIVHANIFMHEQIDNKCHYMDNGKTYMASWGIESRLQQ